MGCPDGIHPGLELFFQRVGDFLIVDDGVELLQKRLDIADDAEINRAVAADFVGGDIDLDKLGRRWENFAEDVEETQPAAQEEHQIGGHERNHGRTRPDGQGAFKAKGMRIRHHAAARARRVNRNADFFHEFENFFFRIGIPQTAAADDDRTFGRFEQIDNLPRVFAVNRFGNDRRTGLLDRGRIDLGIENVAGEFQINRSRPSAHRRAEGHVHVFGNPFWDIADEGFLHHRFNDGKLGHILKVQLFHGFGAHTAGNENDRRVGKPGAGNAA